MLNFDERLYLSLAQLILRKPQRIIADESIARLDERGMVLSLFENEMSHVTDRRDAVVLAKPHRVGSRGVLRQKGTPYDELGLGDFKWADDELLDFMLEHAILINRSIVVTVKGRTSLQVITESARYSPESGHRPLREGRRRGHSGKQNPLD